MSQQMDISGMVDVFTKALKIDEENAVKSSAPGIVALAQEKYNNRITNLAKLCDESIDMSIDIVRKTKTMIAENPELLK